MTEDWVPEVPNIGKTISQTATYRAVGTKHRFEHHVSNSMIKTRALQKKIRQ